MRRVEHLRMELPGPSGALEVTDVLGTVHLPTRGLAVDTDLGFLFFNAGHVPREGHAGTITRVADRLASLGFPVYRFDLPGLGDSPGEIPAGLEDFFQAVHDGIFTPAALQITRQVIERSGCARLVLGGLCGGAATALFVAGEEPEIIAGLIALEPEFLRPGGVDPQDLKAKLTSRASWLRMLTGHSRYSDRFRLLSGLILPFVGRWLLPAEANRTLIDSLRGILRRRVPVLVMLAEGKPRELFYDQLSKLLLRGRSGAHVTQIAIPNTNHIFTSGGAADRIVREVGDWADRVFVKR
jgi:pimeloyl-ACP methyl ester carboxylesterase